MKLYKLITLLVIILSGSLSEGFASPEPLPGSGVLHKYHIGKCLIDYNEQEKALQVSQFMFLDDLEMALRAQGADKLFLCTEKEVSKAEVYLERYLNQHLSFAINGKAQSYIFIGKESSEDLLGIWCYVEITGIEKLEKVQFRNDLLMDIYDDQKNVIIFKGPKNKEASFLFQKGKAEETLEF